MRLALEARERTPAWLNLALPVAAIAATLAASSGLIVLAGADVGSAYAALLAGAFGSRFNFVETLVKAAPMVFTGLAIAVAFRARFWNIGAEASCSPARWRLPSSAPGPACQRGRWRR